MMVNTSDTVARHSPPTRLSSLDGAVFLPRGFLDTEADADAVFPQGTYRRLEEIKARYDPDDAIISAHPVRPVI
jgi:hypothetical protein